MQPPVPVLSVVTYPPGATKTQARIVIDGVRGAVFVYTNGGPTGALIGSWSGKAGTDPYGNAYPAGINVTVGVIEGVTFIGTGSGAEILIYSGTPGANNLILSNSAANTVDQFGNHVLQGFAYYTSSIAYQLTAAGLAHYSGAMQTGWTEDTNLVMSITTMTLNASTNLRVNINGLEITDFTSAGQYITPGVTYQTQLATPSPSAAGNPIVFANAGGQIIVNDAADGTTYNTQTRTTRLTTASGAISSATPASVGLSQAVSARSYWVRARLYITTTSTPQFGFDLVTPAPGTDTGQIGGSIYRAATFTGSVAGAPNANNGIAIALAAGVTYMIDLDGIVTITAAGTLNLNVYNVTGGTGSYTVNAFSGIHVSPL